MYVSVTSDHLPGIGEGAELSVSDEEDDQEGDLSSDDGMELTPKTRREVDEMLARQDKRSRGLHPDDKECRTPPYSRAARSAKVDAVPAPHASHNMPNQPMPFVHMHDYAARATHHPVAPLPPFNHPHRHPIHGFNTLFIMNPYHVGMSVNLHLPNVMPPPPGLPPP
jgi:hypothetical protein